MWRTILLGKLGISILASLIVGFVCVSQPWRAEYTIGQASSWIGVGIFFLVLSICQILAVYLMTKRPKPRSRNDQFE